MRKTPQCLVVHINYMKRLEVSSYLLPASARVIIETSRSKRVLLLFNFSTREKIFSKVHFHYL